MKMVIFAIVLLCVSPAWAGGKDKGVITILSPPAVVTIAPSLVEEEEVCEWKKVPMERVTQIPVNTLPVLLPVGCGSVMLPIGGGVESDSLFSGYRWTRVCRKKTDLVSCPVRSTD